MSTFRTRIDSLFVGCRPSAIGRRVITIVVSTINRAAYRPCANVRVEGRETSHPSSAHLDAAAAIIVVVFGVGIGASLLHRGPDIVFSRMGATVNAASVSEQFISKTAARGSISVSQFVHFDGVYCAAVAATQPPAAPVFACAAISSPSAFAYYHQAAEALSGQVDCVLPWMAHITEYNTMNPGGWLQRIAECPHG